MLFKAGNRSRWVTQALIVLLVVLTPISFFRMGQLTLRSKGSWDFYQFWFAGTRLLNGQTPYIVSPETNSDNLIVPQGINAEMMGTLTEGTVVPTSNLPAIVLMLSVFSVLSFAQAKIAWFIVNIIFVILIPLLLFKWHTLADLKLNKSDCIILTLLFYNLLVTKLAIESGQVSLLMMSLLPASLVLARKHSLASGILLGLALSKYTFAAPVVLFFLLRRQFRIVAIAVCTQLVGLILLSLVVKQTPWDTVGDYMQVVSFVAANSDIWGHAIQLATLFPAGSVYGPFAVGLMTLLVGIVVARFLYKEHTRMLPAGAGDLQLLTLLVFWSLLVVYHGDYDAILCIFFFVLVLVGLRHNSLWHLSQWQSWLLGGIAVGLGLMGTSIYTRLFYIVYPAAVDVFDVGPVTITTSLLLMLATSLWLVVRAIRVSQTQSMLAVAQPSL